jgi:phage protein D
MKPAWKVTLDGKDLTAALVPRLIRLSITSCRQDNADQLDIALSDHDGRLALPPKGATLHVHLGWSTPAGTQLTDMGTFVVDEREHAGAPDVLTLRARSAHMRSDLRAQREQSYHDTTLGALVNQLAGRNHLVPQCAAALAAQVIDHIDQTNESDIAFLTRLGKRYDAVATIKAGALILAPIGSGQTASGKPLPSATLTRADGDQHRYHDANREAYSGVRARYHDPRTGHTQAVMAGTDDGKGVKQLRTIYATRANALRAARSVYQRLQRGTCTFDYQLALGNPALYPEMHITLRGWKPDIDAIDWIIDRAEHTLGEQGLATRLELQYRSADDEPDADADA